MKKNTLRAILLACFIALPSMFALTSCGHKHSFSDVWSTDATSHWHDCTGEKCSDTKDSAKHTFVMENDDTKHWKECSVCGYQKDEHEHTLLPAINGDKHTIYCEDCEYSTGELDHTFETDEQTTCDNCGHERAMASLSFKTGTYAFTYDGLTHAFDKKNLVEYDDVELSEVVVEYSTSKDSPVWTEDVPKNAGTYYTRLSVPATKDHTACTIDNLNETEKVLTINKKSISLNNLVLVYKASEMNTNAKTMTLTLTSSDVDGLCESDTLTATITKKAVTEATNFYGEGTEWTIKDRSAFNQESEQVGIEISATDNYDITGSITGKLYVAKEMTQSGEESPYTYTAEATIKKDGIVCYSVAVATGSAVKVFEAKNFDVTLSDSNAKIVGIIPKASWLRVNLTADGTLVVYGRVPEDNTFPFYIAVQYTGSVASKAVTLTLTPNTATTAVTDEEFTNALSLSDAQYHATIKKGDSVTEEYKIDRTNGKYYKNDNGTEVYYEKYNTSFFKYYKNADKWVRELVSDDESSVLNATKFTSKLLSSLTKNELIFSSAEQMYKLNSKVINGTSYTDVALKFEDKKLVYVEYKMNNETYTFEFEYVAPEITMPSGYAGTTSDNPITAGYVNRGDNARKFMSTGTIVTTANSTIYYSFEITDAVITAIGSTTTNTCTLSGNFTADETDVTFSDIKVYKSDGKTEVTNTASGNGRLLLQGLEKGTYIISVKCDKACTLSLILEKYELSA